MTSGLPVRRSWAVAAVLVVTFLLFGAGIWTLSADARREIDALATANADSTQWSLAQSEVEFLRLRTAILEADPDDPKSLDRVRRTFDVFYSRVQTIRSSRNFADVQQVPDVAEALAAFGAFLDHGVPLIDGPDETLGAALPDLDARSARLAPDLRTVSLAGVKVFARRSEAQREQVASALRNLALVAILLAVLVVAFIALMALLLRSSRRRAEQLQLAESRLRAIATTSLDAILVVGRDGRILDFNGAAQQIFGYTPKEAIGQPMADLIVPAHHRPAHDAGMHRFLTGGEKRVVGKGRVQLEARDKTGRIFPVDLSIETAESADGTIFVSFLRDISRRAAAERDLVEARDRALAGEKAKAEMLATMSHEMRTPLNGILGTLQLLGTTVLDARQRGYAEMMETSGRMLLHHVNTVLDISRTDAGMVRSTNAVFDPVETLQALVGALSAQAAARGNVIVLRPGGDPPGLSIGDSDLLSQILANLIGNAIKFTENGRIDIECERLPGGDLVEVRVSDTGIGIAEDQLDRVFEDFVTLDPSYSRKVEGTGLGLGIVRRLVAVMQGEVGVESEPGEGSVFWVRIPLASAEPEASPAPRLAPERPTVVSGATVLLVEDNEINRLVARGLLDSFGCDVTEAHDGEAGVALSAERRFDIILMDISMPRLDGVSATRAIREGGGPNAATPVIALTAHALPVDRQRFREAGMTDVVIKPLMQDDLRRALAPHLATKPDKALKDRPVTSFLTEELSARAWQELEAGLRTVEDRLAAGEEPAGLRFAIHRLAGTAAVLGATDLHEAFRAAESAAALADREQMRAKLLATGKFLKSAQSRQ
jgi:PAS domain S-box-containing protein